MENNKSKKHKRNWIICVVSVLVLILIEFGIGFMMGRLGIITSKEEMLNIQIGLNVLGGIIFSTIFIWYGFTLQFRKRWWIIPAVVAVYLLNIYLGYLPWLILLGILGIRYRNLTKNK